MNKSHTHRPLAALLLSLLSALLSPDVLSATKVMLLGDSITELNWQGGYRPLLCKKLLDAGYVFDFVGTNTSNHNDTNLGFAFPQAYWDHEGYTSATIDIPGSVWQWSAKLRNKLAANSPDIMLVLLGVNDITNGTRSAAQIANTMSAFLDSIWAFKPAIKVVLSNLTPMFPGGALYNATAAQKIQQYNALLPAMVAAKVQAGRYCELVDNYSALTLSSDVEDGVHPSVTGYPKLANAWYPAVSAAIGVSFPNTLAFFNASLIPQNNYVRLDWKTISEINNSGIFVQKDTSRAVGGFKDISGSFQQGHGTTSVAQNYSYTDSTAKPGKWVYRLKQVDLDGTVNLSEPVTVDIPGIAGVDDELMPASFTLEQNYPNPFNPTTTIRYGLPHKSNVTLKVYNSLGQQVAVVLSGEQGIGSYEVKFDGAGLASGMYFYRLEAGTYVETKKLMLIR